MEISPDNRSFIWVVDDTDKLVHVNDAWLAFARENGAPQLTAAAVLGQPLWHFIQGQETIYLYKHIFDRFRAGNSPVRFPFRCDAPDCRRLMEMQLSLIPGAAIQFTARQLWQESRQPLDILGASRDRSDEFLKICSWCKKMYIPARGWGEPEEAIEALDLFGGRSMPRMTHTICDACHDFIKQELSRESDPGEKAD